MEGRRSTATSGLPSFLVLWVLTPIADFNCGCALKCVSWITHDSSQSILLFKDDRAPHSHWFWPHLCSVCSLVLCDLGLPLGSARDFGDVSQASSLLGIFVKLSLSFSRIFLQECLSCRKVDQAYKALTKLGSSQFCLFFMHQGRQQFTSTRPSPFGLSEHDFGMLLG